MEPLQEVELLALAEDIDLDKYLRLCNALGYTYAKSQAILRTHLKNVYEALAEILITWKTKQRETDQLRFILASKLHEVGLGDLGDSLSKGSYHLNRRYQRDRHDRETVPSQMLSADIYAKKISESLTVGQCREKLASKYKNLYGKIQKAPWDPTDLAELKDLHTVVTMVKKDAHGKNTKTKEILQGSVDEIFSAKVEGELPLRILISAPAGRGKTTAVAKMAYDWANRVQGSSLENLPLLFVVKLRNANKRASIAEAIRSQLLSDVLDLTQDGLHRFIADNQGICHIILDGLDEYAGIAANGRGLGSNIVDVMQWKEYPHCRVLVTTRPHLENFFNRGELPKVYTKMWIEGFSHDNSREYIDKFFVLTLIPSNGQGLKDFLDNQPLINELVITPLFCLMVCHLWNEGLLGSQTTTQTDLLDSVNIFLMHHANARSKSSYKITYDELGKIICKLGKVALTGLLDDSKKLVFTPRDFWWVPAILERACALGILSKTTTRLTGLPRSHVTSSTSIEFYHKLAQEHSAGKYLADQTNKYLLRWKISKLDRVIRKIKAHIGDYENLIRFTAGTENNLCIRIMEALLANSSLDESERYRIILDCSSETKGTDGSVSSLVQRCVTAERIVLKSPTVYTVVGMEKLPQQLKDRIQEVKFEDSTIYTDVTSGLWSCLHSFPDLHTLTISDSSLSFPPSPPELTTVNMLIAKRVTSQSYEGLLSSIPNVKEIDISVDNAENEDISQIQTSLRQHLTGQELTLIRLDEPSLEESVSSMTGETMRRLGLLTSDRGLQATLSRVVCGPKETVIDLVQHYTRMMSSSLYTEQLCGSLNSDRHACNMFSLTIRDCKLTAEITSSMWSSLRSFPSLSSLIISDSPLSFPPSPPQLTSVTKLKTERATSQSYEGLLSSIPNVNDITVGNAENEDMFQIQTSLRRHLRGQELTLIRLDGPHSLPSEESVSGMSTEMRGLGLLTSDSAFREATLFGVICGPKETVIDLVQRSRRLMSSSLYTEQLCGSLNSDRHARNMFSLTIRDCKLTAEITSSMWSSLRSFPSLSSLIISDSPLSFPPSLPELKSITKLKTERATSQSYEGLLSSIPNVNDITVGSAENEDMFQIQTSLRRHLTGQELTLIKLDESSSEESVPSMSRETMRGLGLLTNDSTFREVTLSGVVCGPKETVIDLVQSSTHVMSSVLYSKQVSESLNSNRETINIGSLMMRDCKLTAVVASSMWSCLRSFPSLGSLTISDSSLSFPPSPPKLTSITEVKAERVTSQSYEGLLSSLPGLHAMDIIIDDAERDTSQIMAGLRRTGGKQLRHINLQALDSLPPEKKNLSRETMKGLSLLIREHIKRLESLSVLGVKCMDKDIVDLIESLKILPSLHFQFLGWGSFDYKRNTDKEPTVTLGQCQLSTEMTIRLWTCLRTFPSLSSLTISDSSPSFPPSPPELTSVTWLEAKRVTSENYEGLLSSLPGLKAIDITTDDAERDISQITAGLCRTTRQQLTSITIKAPEQLPLEKKNNLSRETMRGLSLLIREQTKNLQSLSVSGVKCIDEDYVDLIEHVQCSKILRTLHFQFLGWGSLDYNGNTDKVPTVTLGDCQLSTEMAVMLWTSLRSFTSLKKLTISDSSLSFPPSPPEPTSVKRLKAERVTSQSYEGLLSSLPGLEVIDISIGDAEGDISQITAGLRRTGGQQLGRINLQASDSLPPEKKNLSRETMKGLSLLMREHIKNLQSLSVSGVKCTDEDYVDLIEHVLCSKMLRILHFQFLGWGSLDYKRNTDKGPTVTLSDCQLSTEMAVMLWTSLRSFTSLKKLIISDSSLSFPPSPPELTSVTELKAKGVTSQSYEGLLSSLPGLEEIDITMNDAERDIPQITAGLRGTGGQKLTHIDLLAQDSLSEEERTVSRETMRGLGLLIKEQTKNLQKLYLHKVQCTNEEDLVDLVECCRHVKAMRDVWIVYCGTTCNVGGRLKSHLSRLPSSPGNNIAVEVTNDDNLKNFPDDYSISHID